MSALTVAILLLLGCGGSTTRGIVESTGDSGNPAAPGIDGSVDSGADAQADGVGADGADADDASLDARGASDAAVDAAAAPESGATLDAAAEAGSVSAALRFDGVAAYLSLPAAAGGANETAFSSEIWFKTTAPTGMLFEVYSSSMPGADRSTYLKAGQVCFYVYTPAFSELCTSARFNDDAWHNVAATLGASGQLLYVDGTLQGLVATVTSSAFNYNTGFRVGYGYIGPNGPLTYFAGDIDDIRIWSVQRTADELRAGRGQAIDPATPGLQGYWKLDESGSAMVAPDSTAALNHGTLLGFSFNPSPWIMPGAF